MNGGSLTGHSHEPTKSSIDPSGFYYCMYNKSVSTMLANQAQSNSEALLAEMLRSS